MATKSNAKQRNESEIKATNLTKEIGSSSMNMGTNSRARRKMRSGFILPRSEEIATGRHSRHAVRKSSVPGRRSAAVDQPPFLIPITTAMQGSFVSLLPRRETAGSKRLVGMSGSVRSKSVASSSFIRRRQPTATRVTSSGWTARSVRTGRDLVQGPGRRCPAPTSSRYYLRLSHTGSVPEGVRCHHSGTGAGDRRP